MSAQRETLLTINADDIGLSKDQNYGIIEAYHDGVVSSTTAKVNGREAQHAATLCQQLHLVLIHGYPVSATALLVDERGELGKWLWAKAETGPLTLDEIQLEMQYQFDRFAALPGRPPGHVDSHHPAPMLSQFYPLVGRLRRVQRHPFAHRPRRGTLARPITALPAQH